MAAGTCQVAPGGLGRGSNDSLGGALTGRETAGQELAAE